LCEFGDHIRHARHVLLELCKFGRLQFKDCRLLISDASLLLELMF